MHEVAVVKGIVDAALRVASSNDARRVTALGIVIGDESHVTDEAFRFNFEVLSAGTIAEGAMVRVRRESRLVNCWDCMYAGPARQESVCPRCGSGRIDVSPFRDCVLESIDVEEPGDA